MGTVDPLDQERKRILVDGMTEGEFRLAVLNKLDEIGDSVEEVHQEIYGDPKRGEPGIKKRQEDVEEKVEEHDRRWSRATATITGVSIGAGLASGGLVFGLLRAFDAGVTP